MVRVLSVLVVILFSFGLLATKIQSVIGQNRTAPAKPITIVLGGDVMLGRSVTGISLDAKKDPTYPFLFIGEVLRAADLTLVNLESPIIERCPRSSEGLIFCAPAQMLQGLTFSGVDIVNLANNHSLNYGSKGLAQTKTFLSDQGIEYTDNSHLVVRKLAETSFGFVGFDKSQQSNPVLTSVEENLVYESNQKVDFLFVSIHWGAEYQLHPTEGQMRLANRLVELGADVLVGHHPHWVQDTDYIGTVPVYYSLGNLVFDQDWSEKTKQGLIIRLTMDGGKIIKEEKIPTYMKNFAQPQLGQ